jgi:hypothetical protein
MLRAFQNCLVDLNEVVYFDECFVCFRNGTVLDYRTATKGQYVDRRDVIEEFRKREPNPPGSADRR